MAGLYVPDPSLLPTSGPDVFARTPGAGGGGSGLAELQAIAAAAPSFQSSFQRPERTYGPDIWTNSAGEWSVQGKRFAEDDAQSALDSEQLLSQPGTGGPPDNSGDWQAVDPQAYSQFLDSIKNPSMKRLAKKNFGIGIDQSQMLLGRGLQFAGAEQTGGNMVAQQQEDLRKTLPFNRQFSDIDSGHSAAQWLVANFAQQGPNLIESIATALVGAAAGTVAGGPAAGAGAALAGLAGKAAWKKGVIAALEKQAAGGVLDVAEHKLIREAAGMAGAAAATTVNNLGMGVSDVYGELRDSGVGANDNNARMSALWRSAPYAALESLPEFVLAFKVFNPGNLARSTAGMSLGKKGLEYGRRAGLGLLAGGALEGTTEAGQEGLLIGANDQVDWNSPEGKSRLLNSFAAGFGIGGPLGGVANLRGGKPANLLSNTGEDPTSPVATASEVPPEGDPGVGPQTPPFFQNEMPFQQPSEMPPLVGPSAGLAMPEADPNIGPQEQRQQQMDFGASGDQLDLFSEQPPPQQPPVRSPWSPSQPIMGPDAPTGLPNPAQGAMQFAGPPPAGPNFGPPLPPRQERRTAAFDQAEAARIAAETDAAYQQRNLQQLPPSMAAPLPPAWSNSGQSGELALDNMPMVPVTPTPPQQGNLFPRAPRTSAKERLRRGIVKSTPEATNEELAAERDALLAERVTVARAIAVRDGGGSRFAQKLKASPLASRLKAIDKRLSELPPAVLPDTGQMGMFTSAGNPTVAALKGAGKTQRVQPVPDTTVTQAPPTGKKVNPVTVAAARTAEKAKSASDRGLKKQAGVKSEGKVDVQERSAAPLDAGKQAGTGSRVGAGVSAAGQATGATSKLAPAKTAPAVTGEKVAPAVQGLKAGTLATRWTRVQAALETVREFITQPDTTKRQVLVAAKQWKDEGLLDEKDLAEAQRIAKDRDMGAEDVASDLQTTLEILSDRTRTDLAGAVTKEAPPLPKTSAAAADRSGAAANPAQPNAKTPIEVEIDGQMVAGDGVSMLKSIDDRIEKFESLLACLTG